MFQKINLVSKINFDSTANLNSNIKNVAVIGAGGWGTALASLLAESGSRVNLWTFENEVAKEINHKHKNHSYLPGITIHDNVKAITDLNEIDNSTKVIVFATPTQYIRSILSKEIIDLKDRIIINAAKGIEKNTLMRISEIFADVAHISPEQYTVLTGPSHAEEVSRKMLTTVVATSEDHSNEKVLQRLFSTDYFRVYASDDVMVAKLVVALKNVIAIASGIADGLQLGDNSKAALITRGLAEMSRLGVALGANPLTFSGLSGLGDLVVTCMSQHSRNRHVGEQLAQGLKIDDINRNMKMVAEGVSTTESAYFLGKKHKVELPITEQVYRILFEGASPKEALKELMSRKSKREWWW